MPFFMTKPQKQILEDDKAPALALLAVVTSSFGEEGYNWDPLVLKLELQDKYSCKISDLNSDKIHAAITVLTTDMYENNIVVFESVNHFFNNQHHSMEELDPLEAEELITGMTEAYLIRGERLEFSPEVRVYAGKLFYDYGMHKPPTLFPDAIMEEREGSDEDKNAALHELFEAKIKQIEDYIKNE